MAARTYTILLTAALLAFAAPARAQEARTSGLSPAEATEILQLATAGDAFWDAKDAAGLSTLYTEDAHNWMVGTEMDLRGREAIRTFFTASFAQRGPGMRHRTVITELQRISPDVVAADGQVFVEQVGESGAARVLRRFTMNAVAVRGPEGWRIRINRVHPLPQPPAAAAQE